MSSYINMDKNMIVSETIGDVAVLWRDVTEAPFSLYGFSDVKPFFRRVPSSVAEATSEAVARLSEESAGGRVRFSSNSPFVAIRAKFRAVGRSSHLTLVSSAGFDLYIDTEYGSRFVKEFRMKHDMEGGYEQIVTLGESKARSFTIHFPIHSVVEKLEVGLSPEATLGEAMPYRALDPIVIYGSSIVHGTAATRPGLAYPAILSRSLNIDVRNLGFSGNARGEEAIGAWMANLPMSVFISDYDHNAPTAEHLEATHHALYECIREKNPTVPYIMISRPNYFTRIDGGEDALLRRDVIMRSYLKARAAGDKNVYFIDGMSFFMGEGCYDFSIDSIHPNDAGFLRMAEVIGTMVKHLLID